MNYQLGYIPLVSSQALQLSFLSNLVAIHGPNHHKVNPTDRLMEVFSENMCREHLFKANVSSTEHRSQMATTVNSASTIAQMCGAVGKAEQKKGNIKRRRPIHVHVCTYVMYVCATWLRNSVGAGANRTRYICSHLAFSLTHTFF